MNAAQVVSTNRCALYTIFGQQTQKARNIEAFPMAGDQNGQVIPAYPFASGTSHGQLCGVLGNLAKGDRAGSLHRLSLTALSRPNAQRTYYRQQTGFYNLIAT